jgi:hypothetical protein
MARLAFWVSVPGSVVLPVDLLLAIAYYNSPARYGPTKSPEPAAIWSVWDWWEDWHGILFVAAPFTLLSFLVYAVGRAGWALLAMRIAALLGSFLAFVAAVERSPAW